MVDYLSFFFLVFFWWVPKYTFILNFAMFSFHLFLFFQKLRKERKVLDWFLNLMQKQHFIFGLFQISDNTESDWMSGGFVVFSFIGSKMMRIYSRKI